MTLLVCELSDVCAFLPTFAGCVALCPSELCSQNSAECDHQFDLCMTFWMMRRAPGDDDGGDDDDFEGFCHASSGRLLCCGVSS